MRSIHIAILLVGSAILCFAAACPAQEQMFSDASVEYSFAVPGPKWRMTVRPSATSPNVEYVYGDRRDGHLEIRRSTVGKTTLLNDVIQDDEQKREFLPGYVAGKQEPFSGRYNGTVFNFEYVQATKPMSGRYYFLRIDPTTVYVLRFTGQTSILKSIQNETDMMARTFLVKH